MDYVRRCVCVLALFAFAGPENVVGSHAIDTRLPEIGVSYIASANYACVHRPFSLALSLTCESISMEINGKLFVFALTGVAMPTATVGCQM